MNNIQFESAREKEKIRQELRDARDQMLEKAKKSAEQRAQRESQKVLSGETNWMLPSVAAKLDKLTKRDKIKSKKKKDTKKKSKKSKKKKKKRVNSSDTESSSESDKRPSKKKKSKKKRSQKYSESSSDSDSSSESEAECKKKSRKRKQDECSNSDKESDLWVEKSNIVDPPVQRDSWMTDALMLKTFSREKSEKKSNEKLQIDSYDPAKSTRELNPYWKSTGTGLPQTFQKPKNDSDDEEFTKRNTFAAGQTTKIGRNWQKKEYSSSFNMHSESTSTVNSAIHRSKRMSSTSSSDSEESDQQSTKPDSPSAKTNVDSISFLTDQQMNELGAKIIKAEILGNTELAKELKEKLEQARANREHFKERLQNKIETPISTKGQESEEHILLTRTDNRGNCRPLQQSSVVNPNDLYGGSKGRKKSKQQRVETHLDGERVRFFADDDKYDIKQMFEREKYTSASDSNLQFADIASKHKNPNDDLEDIFADKIRRNISKEESDKKELNRAIHEQQKLSAALDNCDKCFDTYKMDKKLLVSMGAKVYLALPWHIGLQPGHCVLVPIQHVTCSTQLDEDTWEEINNFRKALTKMFAVQKKDVIFFEIANKLHRQNHLTIHCVPICEKDAELAPFYFKKAIEESEHEWSVNKQLISLRHKGLRSSIPKGLPYIWVNFGMDSGFAHVIEDHNRFPSNFVQEIIGGLLHLDPSKWRRPQKEQNIIAKVKMFADWWKKYDCSN